MAPCTSSELLDCLPPYQDHWVTITGKQDVKDIIVEVLNSHKEFAPLYDNIALFFDGDTTEDICQNLYDFLKANIIYREEKEDDQTTATPAGLLTRGYGDCKHYSTFSAGVLDALNRLENKGIKWSYRFASYDLLQKNPHHVFVVVQDGKNEIWIDPTPGSDTHAPIWYLDKTVSTMALRRNIAGFNDIGYLEPLQFAAVSDQPSADVVYVAPDQYPLLYNEEPAPVVLEAVQDDQADTEVTPELQSAIEILMNYGIMNDQGEISDKVLNNLAPTLTPDEFEEVTNARHLILAELERSVSISGFFGKLWHGVKKVSLAAPRNAYLSLVALNVFGFATKLYNAVYNSDGTYWQPGQQQLYNFWTKWGGTWGNLRNAIESGHKKRAILGAVEIQESDMDFIDPSCLDDYYQNGALSPAASVGVVPAAAAAWYTVASALIVAITPLILGILKQRAQANQLSMNINPNTGLPNNINPGAPTPGESTGGGFMDKIKQWVSDNPILAAGAAAGTVYLITNPKALSGMGKAPRPRAHKPPNMLLVAGAGVAAYFLLKDNRSDSSMISPVDPGAGSDTGSGSDVIPAPTPPTSTTAPISPLDQQYYDIMYSMLASAAAWQQTPIVDFGAQVGHEYQNILAGYPSNATYSVGLPGAFMAVLAPWVTTLNSFRLVPFMATLNALRTKWTEYLNARNLNAF